VSQNSRFNDILDECLERLLSGVCTVDQCLERYPEHAPELEPLLRTAVATREALSVEPTAEFRARARYQMRSEMDRAPVRSWRAFLSWQPRWAVAIVAVLAVVLAGGGTVLAADSSMPGSPLYPVKLATENVRLALSSSEVARAELSAALANRRIAEIAYAIRKGNLKQVERVTERLNKHLVAVARLSLAVDEDRPSARPQEEAVEGKPKREALPEKEAREVAPEQPSAAARPTVDARDRETGSAREVPQAAATAQRARLKVLLGRYAVNHPARLRALLAEAPEEVRPALLKVIASSVASYRQALKELNARSDDLPADDDTGRGQSGDSPADNNTRPGQSGDSPADADANSEEPTDSSIDSDTSPGESGDSPADNDKRPKQSDDTPTKSNTRFYQSASPTTSARSRR